MKEYIEKWPVVNRLIDLENEFQLNKQTYDGETMYRKICEAEIDIGKTDAADVVERKRGEWKYFHKQNIAVCMNCSFERDLDANFGRAISCPNCGADMREEQT